MARSVDSESSDESKLSGKAVSHRPEFSSGSVPEGKHRSKLNGGRILWVDTLKGLACLTVLLAHIVARNPDYGMYANGCGKIAVCLFMLLSGFLFGRSRFCRGRPYWRRVLFFYRSKMVSLLPEYLIALLITQATGQISSQEFKEILLLQKTWGHLWFMAVLFKFYFVAPLIALLRHLLVRGGKDKARRERRWMYCAVLMLASVVLAFVFPSTAYKENAPQLYWYLPIFLTGIALAEMKGLVKVRSAWFDGLCLAGVLVMLMLTPACRELFFGQAPSRYLQDKYLLISFLWVLVLFGVLFGRYTRPALDGVRFLRQLVVYSYCIYLCHYPLLNWLCGRYSSAPFWIVGVMTVLLTAVVSVATCWLLGIVRERVNVRVQMGAVCLAVLAVCLIG